MNIIKSLILSTFVAACAVAVQARAGSLYTPPSREVSVADLNLGSPQGARAAYRRILTVSRSLCGRDDSTDAPFRAAYLKCVDSTVRDAVAKLNQQEVTRYAESVRRAKTAKAEPERASATRASPTAD